MLSTECSVWQQLCHAINHAPLFLLRKVAAEFLAGQADPPTIGPLPKLINVKLNEPATKPQKLGNPFQRHAWKLNRKHSNADGSSSSQCQTHRTLTSFLLLRFLSPKSCTPQPATLIHVHFDETDECKIMVPSWVP